MASDRRVAAALARAKVMEIDERSKLVMFSDCHRGIGNGADNFAKNQKLFYSAMSHYFRQGYTYIELGDGDDLWENRRMSDIATEYDHIFGLMAAMYREGRLHMLYGNHDMVKRQPKWSKAHLRAYTPGHQLFSTPLFPNIPIQESILLRYRPLGRDILLLHGHQADFFNDRLWRVGRFLVRHVWRPLELIGVQNPTSSATNPKRRVAVERILEQWAEQTGHMVVAGHTHRPVFPERGRGLYYNDGSCVHPRYITALELADGALSLVKWEVAVKPDGALYIMKDTAYGPRPLKECFEMERSPG